jgi:Cytochrome P450
MSLLTESLIFILVTLVLKNCQKYFRMIYLASKIPTVSFSFGTFLEFFVANNKTVFKLISETATTSDDVSKIWLGPILFISINSAEAAKIVFNSKYCADKPFLKFVKLHKGSLFANGDAWKLHRKIIAPYFTGSKLRSTFPALLEKSKICVENVAKMADKGEFDIFSYVSALTLETMLQNMELDVDIQNKVEEYRDIVYRHAEL